MTKPNSASQLNTILVLFLVLRVTVVLLYKPQGLLNAYTDYHHYFRTAQLSEQGYLPYLNSWSEYPPLLTYTTQLIYSVTRMVAPAGDVTSFTYELFSRLLGLFMLVFECGILIVLHRIAETVWDIEKANWVGWVYSSLSVPLFYWNASQTSNFVFFTLLAVYLWLVKKETASAGALALGAVIKLTPVFFIAAIVRFLFPDYRALIRYGIIFALVFALGFAPFILLGGGEWVWVSLTSNGARASWATVWALMDGNWRDGFVGDIPTRTQMSLAYERYGNPALISPLIVTAIFGVIYLALCRKHFNKDDPKNLVWFTTLILLLFHLWSKGWSPQWATLIIPFILLSFPNRIGVTLILIFSALLFIEWPLAAILKPETNIVGASVYALTIVGRTGLFIVMSVMLYKNLALPATTATLNSRSL